MDLLKEALEREPTDKQPSPELLDKIRLRLGTCYASLGKSKEAIDQFDVIAGNPKSQFVAQAKYRSGECNFILGNMDKAIASLAVFRDKPEFQNVPDVTDRALIRLGNALAEQKKWDLSRQALETAANRFPNSPWIHEARYGVAWAQQKTGQFEPAVNTYRLVISGTASELAAKSHLQIGLCRLEQKKYAEAVASFLTVSTTFDYPELSAAALTEAGRALADDNKLAEAQKLWKEVVTKYPKSEWAVVAQKRLDAPPKK